MTLKICLEALKSLRHFKNISYSQKWSSLLYFLFWCSLLDWWQRPLLRCSESTHICLPTAELDYLKYRQSQGGDNCVFMNSGSSTLLVKPLSSTFHYIPCVAYFALTWKKKKNKEKSYVQLQFWTKHKVHWEPTGTSLCYCCVQEHLLLHTVCMQTRGCHNNKHNITIATI